MSTILIMVNDLQNREIYKNDEIGTYVIVSKTPFYKNMINRKFKSLGYAAEYIRKNFTGKDAFVLWPNGNGEKL